MPHVSVNALVIGAGVIGSSVAYHLARLGMTDIRVVDPDLEGSLSSSELNAGGVRATFNQAINIEMSKLTIDFFAHHAQEMGYRDVGYLWLKTSEGFAKAQAVTELQRSLGWSVEEWDVAELRRKIPFIDKTDDLAGALFAPRDGLVNPNLVKVFYRNEARKLGVIFEDRTFVLSSEEKSSSEMEVRCRKFVQLTQEQKVHVLSGKLSEPAQAPGATTGPSGSEASEIRYRAQIVINCAGPWAAEVARALAYESPAYPLRRQVSIFDCRDVDLSPYGMIVDTSGVYFHPEAMNGLAGFAIQGEEPKFNFEYGGEAFFTEYIWAPLFERSSRFERLKHLTGWAGLYDVSPDESAIIGKAARGQRREYDRVFEAHSFSGHGVMHCHSAGVVLAELILNGKYSSLDAAALSADRFKSGKLLHEGAVI
jgi:FAD-dependent oxidoreductase domain-containing protein 1